MPIIFQSFVTLDLKNFQVMDSPFGKCRIIYTILFHTIQKLGKKMVCQNFSFELSKEKSLIKISSTYSYYFRMDKKVN